MGKDVTARIESLLDTPRAADLVRAYFDPTGVFAGATFVTLVPNDPYSIGAADLVATGLLDVGFGPEAVRRLLEDHSSELRALLRAVRPDIDLWDPDAPLEAAATLWQRLREYRGIDWVIAGKLLARKRSRLIPVVDSVVVEELQAPEGEYWRALQQALQDQALRSRVDSLGAGLNLPPEITTLRLLDALIWMRGSESTNARQVRQGLGLPVAPRKSSKP